MSWFRDFEPRATHASVSRTSETIGHVVKEEYLHKQREARGLKAPFTTKNESVEPFPFWTPTVYGDPEVDAMRWSAVAIRDCNRGSRKNVNHVCKDFRLGLRRIRWGYLII